MRDPKGRLRRALVAGLPYGLVEAVRARRLLRGLGAASAGRPYARLAHEARLDLLPPGGLESVETAVDVGANEGRWAAAVAALARPRRLIAVEPSPEILPRLERTLHGVAGATIVAAAAGDSSGTAELHLTAHSHNASLDRPRTGEMDAMYGWGYAVTGSATVQVRTLDEITASLDEISLLKIDVQGHERAVLAGATETLRRTRWLLIESNFRSHYEGDMLFPELHAVLVEHGFVLVGVSPPHVRSGVALWCDSLYERAGAPARGGA